MNINEGKAASPLNAALLDGMEMLDLQQEVEFQVYTRVLLPLDGYVFWQPTVRVRHKGSLHYAQTITQNLDETYGLANVRFTSESKFVIFDESPTNTIFVARIGHFRFAFSAQNGFYNQARLWHYTGTSIPPAMLTALLDQVPEGFLDPNQAIVSNSLPFWLQLNNYPPLYPDFFSNTIPLFPADLVPANQLPPYIAVDVQLTQALQSVPFLDINRNHWQLAQDTVKLTMYGLQNNAALDFMDCVNQYSVLTDNIGIMNMPIINDVKRTEPSLLTIAMKKEATFQVSYYQARVAQIARQLIEEATLKLILATN
jgi:hypothetical protein